ncbi:unnamed protein product [Paramecium octaurelia]|uniref:Uncharacterized protein n=1 Tax=Paramecium octaurelia TaxID=43137 RepID=A0A8S1S072_PAROT|nr:unnamed protein product [Paramecium octaurelia]
MTQVISIFKTYKRNWRKKFSYQQKITIQMEFSKYHKALKSISITNSRNHKNPVKVKYEPPQGNMQYVIQQIKRPRNTWKNYLLKIIKKIDLCKLLIQKKIMQKSTKSNTPQAFENSEQHNIKHTHPFIQKGIKRNQIVKNQLINNDLELIQYITNHPKYDPYKDKDCQQQIQQDILDAAGLSSNKKNIIPSRKPAQAFKQCKGINQGLNASLDS